MMSLPGFFELEFDPVWEWFQVFEPDHGVFSCLVGIRPGVDESPWDFIDDSLLHCMARKYADRQDGGKDSYLRVIWIVRTSNPDLQNTGTIFRLPLEETDLHSLLDIHVLYTSPDKETETHLFQVLNNVTEQLSDRRKAQEWLTRLPYLMGMELIDDPYARKMECLQKAIHEYLCSQHGYPAV